MYGKLTVGVGAGCSLPPLQSAVSVPARIRASDDSASHNSFSMIRAARERTARAVLCAPLRAVIALVVVGIAARVCSTGCWRRRRWRRWRRSCGGVTARASPAWVTGAVLCVAVILARASPVPTATAHCSGSPARVRVAVNVVATWHHAAAVQLKPAPPRLGE